MLVHTESVPNVASAACEMSKPDELESAEAVLRQQLRTVRGMRGLTQRELARLMTEAGKPFDYTAISKIERGERRVLVDELVTFAHVLETPIAELLSPDPDQPRHIAVADGYGLSSIEFRNWLVFGDPGSPRGMRAATRLRFQFDVEKQALESNWTGLRDTISKHLRAPWHLRN